MRNIFFSIRFKQNPAILFQFCLTIIIVIIFTQISQASDIRCRELSTLYYHSFEEKLMDTIVAPAITGRTWRDFILDGIQNANEPGLASITVKLTGTTTSGDNVFKQTLSDEEGLYSFEGLMPGTYVVEFIDPFIYNITIRQAGADPTIDSDGPISDPINLFSGMIENSIDCGFYVTPPADCSDETYPNCETAADNVLCNIYEINDFCTNMQSQFTNYGPICGTSGSAYQNPSWFAFMAASTTVTLIIHATNCVVSPPFDLGVQYAIYTDCTEDEWVVCAALPCLTPGDIYITSSNFESGNVYYLVLDGCNSTQCTYWVEIVEGGGNYQITDPTGITNIAFPTNQVPVGVPVTFTLEGTDDAVNYIWTIDGSQSNESQEQSITLSFDALGTYQLCGQGVSPCDESRIECIIIEVCDELVIVQQNTPVCDGSPVNVELQSNVGSTHDIEIWFEENSYVTGMNNHLFTGGSGIINDTLNLIDPLCEPVEVVYLVQLNGDSIICEGKVDTIKINVWPKPMIMEHTEQVCFDALPKEIDIPLSCEITNDYTIEWEHVESGNSGDGQYIILADSLDLGLHLFNVMANAPWGCSNSGYINVNIHEIDTSIIMNNNTLAALENNAAYQWLNCYYGLAKIVGETNQTFTPLINGSYAVEITKGGCKDTSNCHRFILSDIIENTIGQGLKVFPNPTDGLFQIEMPRVFNSVEAMIINSEGKTIDQMYYYNTQKLHLNLQNYIQGLYLIHIHAGDRYAMVKIFKF